MELIARIKETLGSVPPNPQRVIKRIAHFATHKDAPFLTQLVVTRRCNLSCGYCNEYDDFSDPVPTEVLFQRIDHLAALGNFSLTLTGGEPFLHPDLDKLVARAVSHGMIVTSISNAYGVTKKRIDQMNEAGLFLLQVSVDNMEPNDVSQKSWSKIKKRLLVLKEHAEFKININAVLGSSPKQQTEELIKEIQSLGFYMTVGLLHDHQGRIDPGLIGDTLPTFYEEMRRLCNKSFFHQFGEGWEHEMLRDGESPWKCRAGARYLYVDENGVVSYCSQRRNDPGTQILEYGSAELLRAYNAPKGCESTCTIGCVRRASSFDEWRPQTGPLAERPMIATDDRVRLPQL